MGLATKIPPAPPDARSELFTTNLSWLLSQASHALGIELTGRLEAVGLAPRGYCILQSALAGEKTQSEIAHEVGLDKTTMVVTMDSLEAAGFAERMPSTKDRRAHVIHVTKAGRRKVSEAEAVVEQVHDDVLSDLSPTQRKTLLAALNRLIDGPLSTPSPCSQPPRRRAVRQQ